MENQTFSLEAYLIEPQKIQQGGIARIDRKLEELSDGCFGPEEFLKRKLRLQRVLHTYSKISPEFLRLSSKKYIECPTNNFLGYIKVPRFSVYSLSNPNMKIDFGYASDLFRFFFKIEEPKGLSKVINKELARGNELFVSSSPKEWEDGWGEMLTLSPPPLVCPKIPKDIRKKYKKIGAVSIKSSFHGLIPEDSRQKIKQAQNYFDNIYFVAETKPEEWTVSEHIIPRFLRDPLIVGVFDKNCFLIDKFETTPVEDYVSKEFTF